MTVRRIALVGYPAVYFRHFAQSLQDDGFEVYWICGLRADALTLVQAGVPSSRVLDVNEGFAPGHMSLQQARQDAHHWESNGEPRVNDLILMDRLLSLKPTDFSLKYMAHLGSVVNAFLMRNRIGLASSWRDTALQLMTMLVCKRSGVPFVVPTRARIPQELYMFGTAHHTAEVLQIREVAAEDRAWAQAFLDEFRGRGVKPALKRAARGFGDVLRMFPTHFRAFAYEVRRAPADRGNDYARYPLARLMRMYLQRKLNLLMYKMSRPGETQLPDERFALYALHTQPESSIDVSGSYFSDQVGLVKFIARSLPASLVLYVKVHPTDVDGKSLAFYRQLKRIPGVRLVDFAVDSRSLLMRCDLLFALTGTIAYEAALLGKPVVTFAKNFFNDLPAVRFCDAPPRLPALVQEVLANPTAQYSDRDTVEFLARLRAASYSGEVSRFHQGHHVHLSADDLAIAKRAYADLFAFFSASQPFQRPEGLNGGANV